MAEILTEAEKLADWRSVQWTRITLDHGISPDLVRIARDADVDPRRFEELLDRGCPHETAVDILT